MGGKKIIFIGVVIACAYILSGCASYLSNTSRATNNEHPKATWDNPLGMPWVESRKYRVYVYAKKRCILCSDEIDEAKFRERDKDLMLFKVLDLTDKVNDEIIDASRGKWMINYQAWPFATGSLDVSFHESGAVKKIGFTSESGAPDAAEAAKEIGSFEKQRLTQKKEILELKNAINKAEKEAAIPTVGN